METASSSQYKIYQCFKCLGDTKYFCESCPCDMCPQCKDNHVRNLLTIDHNVVSYHRKLNCVPKQEICERHPSHFYVNYCEICELPLCLYCTHHEEHRTQDLRIACKTKQQQHRRTIHTIRSEALFNRSVLLPRIKADFKTCRNEFSLYQSNMLTKAQKLKDLIDFEQNDFM